MTRGIDSIKLLLSLSSQTTGMIMVVIKRKSVAKKPRDAIPDVAGKSTYLVPLQINKCGTRSHASVAPRPVENDVDMIAPRVRIQERHAKNGNPLASLAGNQKSHMFTLFYLFVKKKQSIAVKEKVQEFT